MEIGVKYGLLAGAARVALFLLLFFLNKEWMLSYTVYYLSVLLVIIAMYLATSREGELAETYPTQAALRTAFLTFVVANAVFYSFYFIIHQLDPSLAEIQKEMARAFYPMITPKDQLETALEALEKTDFTLTLSQTLFRYARSLIAGFILAGGIGYVTRRN